MNREQFEKWCCENKWNIFRYPNNWKDGGEYCDPFVNGAWYAYQQQQKKIDIVKDEINNFFDNQTTTPSPREYANKIADILELLK